MNYIEEELSSVEEDETELNSCENPTLDLRVYLLVRSALQPYLKMIVFKTTLIARNEQNDQLVN